VIDAAVVDERRRLILIRRDDTEHLMLIGGPNDLLIEANIPAAAAAPRQATAPYLSTSGDTLPPAETAEEGSTLGPQPGAAVAEPPRPQQPRPRGPQHPPRPEPLQQPTARLPEHPLRAERPSPQPTPGLPEHMLRSEPLRPQPTPRLSERMLRPEPPMQLHQGPPPLPSSLAQTHRAGGRSTRPTDPDFRVDTRAEHRESELRAARREPPPLSVPRREEPVPSSQPMPSSPALPAGASSSGTDNGQK
jgi:hypothetical protein